MGTLTVDIPDDVAAAPAARHRRARSAQRTGRDALVRRLLSLGKARQRAGLSCRDFEALLGTRQVPQDYTEADLKANLDGAFGDEPANE